MNYNGWVKVFLEFSSLPSPSALCNSIAIFSTEGSSPKNVCVLELGFLESPEQNTVVSDDKNHSMFLCIFVTLCERYWKMHSNRQEMSDREVLHLQQHECLTIVLLHYAVMSFCLIISVFYQLFSAKLPDKTNYQWFGRLGPAWSTCWTTVSFCFCLSFKTRIMYLMYFSRMLRVEILRTKSCGGTTVT